MATQDFSGSGQPPRRPPSSRPAGSRHGGQAPEWADGLRKLYDSVVDEPLPDAFRDLLDKLDRDA
ncbi:MAG: NepR family anti-sigma factor [Sphingomonadaceae bacterium]